MKKGLLALLLVAVSALTFGISALGAVTGNLVIHFQKWDGDYSMVGLNSWGDAKVPGMKNPDERPSIDTDFGIKFEFNDIAISETGTIGFQMVIVENGEFNWNKKLANVEIPKSKIIENKTTHVYLFEGQTTRETSESNFAYPLYAEPDKEHVVVIYFDPSGNYEENLGFHSWGWETNANGWNDPLKNFVKVGRAEDGTFVYGAIHTKAETSTTFGGLIVYYGDGDGSKKTGNIEVSNSENSAYIANPKPAGEINFVYVVNAGDGVTNNNNVYMTGAAFSDAAFAFKLLPFSPEDMSGTYAINPNTLVVKTSSSVASPYAAATTDAERVAAEALITTWFQIKEDLGNGQYGPALEIERVDFGKTNTTLNTFVIALAEGSELDNTKDYEVFFDTQFPEDLAVAREITVTLNVTVPDNTPANATISLGASFGGWNPADAAYAATKQSDGSYSITFTISVTAAYSTHEYKWTQGTWSIGENVASNRSFVLSNDMTSITFNDEILAWDNDPDAADTKYPTTARTVFVPTNASASLALDLDTEAPVLTFVSPLSFVGKAADQRIIEVPWGQPFDQSLFPRYSVTDNRDGDITSFVFVPKGNMSVLNTAVEGDYTIMLQVVDKWGNVTQETFIFRVVKGE